MEYIDTNQKNPKQIFIDWINGINTSASKAKKVLDKDSITRIDIDLVTDYLSDIIGQCKAIMIVLDNTE